MSPRLRPGTSADLAHLSAIDRHSPGGGWAVESFAQELALAWSRLVVAEGEGGALVGFAVYWMTAGEVELLNVAVAPAQRRAGLGRLLVTHVVEAARAAAAERVLLEVRAGNTAARRLYAALGFREQGVRAGYYQGDGEDAVLMELPLR